MTNYEAVLSLQLKQMADLLDQIYLTGLNNGMYSANSGDDSVLEDNPFDIPWLMDSAEKAVLGETDENGDEYWLGELCQAIMRNAGISQNES